MAAERRVYHQASPYRKIMQRFQSLCPLWVQKTRVPFLPPNPVSSLTKQRKSKELQRRQAGCVLALAVPAQSCSSVRPRKAFRRAGHELEKSQRKHGKTNIFAIFDFLHFVSTLLPTSELFFYLPDTHFLSCKSHRVKNVTLFSEDHRDTVSKNQVTRSATSHREASVLHPPCINKLVKPYHRMPLSLRVLLQPR